MPNPSPYDLAGIHKAAKQRRDPAMTYALSADSRDAYFEEVGMTKPEGPAQEPQSLLDAYKDADGFATLLAHTVDPSVIGKLEGVPLWNHALIILECNARQKAVRSGGVAARLGSVTPSAEVPATPAPSQPAGAREQWMEDAAREFNRTTRTLSDDEIDILADVIARHAAQQTAAKDARIQEQHERAERAIEVSLREKHLREAAERERDSLREALTRIDPFVARGAGELRCLWCGNKRPYHHDTCEYAALKAGKE